MTEVSRRGFLRAAAAAAALGHHAARAADPPKSSGGRPSGPTVIASANGLPATAKAAELIAQGVAPVDAVVAGVAIVEADPTDHSVGLGGLPNERGVVELDASVMDGPTHNSGAVAGLQRIRHPAQVALRVLRRTDHAILVGAGALEFARAHGFEEENLLTDEARRIWLKWKESHSDRDDWIPPVDAPDAGAVRRDSGSVLHTYGTINCDALDARGNLGGVTSTSGLSYKLPGRVGDSPIIGAGLYVDNEVGAAGSTGRGEAVIKNCASFATVEQMRAGKSPTDACLAALGRIVAHVKDARLRRADGRPNFDVKMYALAKDGRFGAASIWSGARFAVYSNGHNRLEDAGYLFDRPEDMKG
ncbi:MAG: N(4)-(beta-N-acetylglucosaminyl)-L-asparaginase [bacterium]|nr:N(4)-(beta-N-acetylglucosaminyl)-L-asparaginase [bacterium]